MANSVQATAQQPTFLLARQSPVQRLLWITVGLALILLLATVIAVGSGSARIPYDDVTRILLYGLGTPLGADIPDSQITIVHQVRLPRVIAAIFIGAALAVAGAVMQGIFRNPLADPGILGVSVGGSLGAIIAFSTGLALAGLWVVPLFAFVGAMAAASVVYVLSMERGRTDVTTLLLAGIALNAFMGALITLQILISDDPSQMQTMLAWLVGSLSGRGWRHVYIIIPSVLISIGLIYRYSRDLNLFLLGEETAQGLGTNVPRTRFILLALTALTTGAAVSMAGAIGFIGLVVPHMLRLLVGPDHRILLPASALGGGAFLVIADTITRIVIANQELPVGLVTSMIGGPFFLYLLWRYRRNARLQ
jgi:iron complex transport system permease protein